MFLFRKFTVLSILICSFTVLSAQVVHPNIDCSKELIYNGHKFLFYEQEEMKIAGKTIKSIPLPETMDGEAVLNFNILDVQPSLARYKTLKNYIQSKLKPVLSTLEDGNYMLNINVAIVDKSGKLVYYDFRELTPLGNSIHKFSGQVSSIEQLQKLFSKEKSSKSKVPQIDSMLKIKIETTMLNALINCPRFNPGKKNGKFVHCYISPFENFDSIISIKGGKVYFE